MDLNLAAKALAKQFDQAIAANKDITRLYARVRDGTAGYEEALEFASRSGQTLGNICAADLVKMFPNGVITEAEAMQLLPPALQKNHTYVTEFTRRVQEQINARAGIKLGATVAEYPKARVAGLAKELAQKGIEAVKDSLASQIENLSMSTVDDCARENMDAQANASYKVRVIREYHPEDTDQSAHHGSKSEPYEWCEFCKEREGVYDYEDVKDTGNPVWQRHEGCHCTITYISEKRTDTVYNGHRSKNERADTVSARQRQGLHPRR